MNTETLDKFYLEWSQFTSARTARELALEKDRTELRAALKDAAERLRGAGMLSDTDEILVAMARYGPCFDDLPVVAAKPAARADLACPKCGSSKVVVESGQGLRGRCMACKYVAGLHEFEAA